MPAASEADMKQYELLAGKIATLEVDAGGLPQEKAKLAGIEQSLGAYTHAMQQSSKVLEKEKAESESMEHSKMRRKLLGSKFEALAAKEKAEFQAAYDKYKTVSEQVEKVTAAAAAQRAAVAQLTQSANELEAARMLMKELVGKAYSGPAGSPEENTLEAELAALGPKKQGIVAEAQGLGVASQHLASAGKQLSDAFRQLQIGHRLNGMDTMGNFMGPAGGGGLNPGGLMGDLAERQAIKAAGQLVSAAMGNIQQAYAAAPGLPPIRAGALDNMKVFGSHLIGGAMFDMAKQRKIQEGLQHIQVMLSDVQRGQQWLAAENQKVNARVAAVQEEHRQKDNQLMHVRMQLMAAATA